MSSGVWTYSIGATGYKRGAYLRTGQDETIAWRWVAPLPYVTEVIIRRDGSGKRTIREYRLTMDPATGTDSTLCSDDDLDNGAWMPKLDLPKVRDPKVKQAIGTAIGMLGDDAPRIEAVPTWTPDGLQLPPGDVGPYGYAEVAGTEDDARQVWGEVGAILARPGNSVGAFYLGTGIGSLFLAAFKRQGFICHACGGSSGGKSTMIRLTGAMFGRQEDVVGSWSLAKVATSEDLLRLGVLPSFRDEIGRLGRLAPREAEQLIFNITEGAQRTRARQKGGGVDRTTTWRGVLFSAGNDSLLGMATEQEGLNVRVVEVPNLMTADKETSARLAALTELAYGWPLRWAREIPLEDAWQAIAKAERELGTSAAAGADVRIGQNLALGIAGAELFEQITGTSGVRASALKAGLDLYSQLVSEMRETSMKQGDKLLSVIAETFASKPSLFPTKVAYTSQVVGMDAVTEAYGVTYTEGTEQRIAVFSGKLRVICETAGIISPRTGLRDLKKDGVLVLEESKSRQGLTKREWLGQAIGDVPCYVFRKVASQEPEAFKAGPVAGVADLPLPPMPTLPEHMRGQSAKPTGQVRPAATAQELPEVPAQAGSTNGRRTEKDTGRRKVTAVTQWAVVEGCLMDPTTGASVPLEGDARTSLPALLDVARSKSPAGDLTLVIDSAVREAYGLPVERLGMGFSAWTLKGQPSKKTGHGTAFWPLVKAGWHQPHKPGDLPVVMATTTLQHPDRPGFVRLTVADWLLDGQFPKGPTGDAAGALEMVYRLGRFRDLTKWAFTSSAANTAVQALRDGIDATARRVPRYVPEQLHKWPTWSAADSWRRDLVDGERELAAHGYDAVKNYLPAYGQAIVAGAELEHGINGEFDASRAGYWLIVLPSWPHQHVPAPVHDMPAGARVWVTTAIVKQYHELGMEPAVQESWTAPAVGLAGFRDFYRTTWEALKVLEAGATDEKGRPVDLDDAAVWDALKTLYRTLHGKLRQRGQHIVARPDWGAAVRDAAWTGVLRKVYKAAGVLPMAKDGSLTASPRFPVKLDLDEAVYAATGEDPAASVPAGFVIGRGLGQFRPKTAMTMTDWLAGQNGGSDV